MTTMTNSQSSDLTFEQAVKKRKAGEWLLVTDPVLRQAAGLALASQAKVDNAAYRMNVTDKERDGEKWVDTWL